MTLNVNQIVELANGNLGYVASFNGKPEIIIFKSYSNTLKKYNEKFENRNPSYNIVKIYDGSSITDSVSCIFRKSFDVTKLKVIWAR